MSTQIPLVTNAEEGNTVTDNLVIIHPEAEDDLLQEEYDDCGWGSNLTSFVLDTYIYVNMFFIVVVL